MEIDVARFRVRPGESVDLRDRSTKTKPLCDSKAAYEAALATHVKELDSLQQKLYASNAFAVLVILQGMDTSGKDGAIRHVMSGVDPRGCNVFSFKHPSPEELEHDFLWRTTRQLPERGQMAIFNRSYYEEVLIVRVHPEIFAAEGVPGAHDEGDVWDERYRSILSLERHLHKNGTRIVKFFLHLSKEEQRKRLVERIDDPTKNWKFGDDDLRERGFWGEYRKAYEECLSATSTKHSPWYVVPADRKHDARLIVSKVLLDTLRETKPHYPTVTRERRRQLLAMRRKLTK